MALILKLTHKDTYFFVSSPDHIVNIKHNDSGHPYRLTGIAAVVLLNVFMTLMFPMRLCQIVLFIKLRESKSIGSG